MPTAVFCYGTLEFEPILRAVCALSLPMRKARLPGYARYAVRGAAYPGLIAEAGALTEGTLLEGVTPRLLRRLDAYEGPEYQRVAVGVESADGRVVPAWTYLYTARSRLSAQPWSAAGFARRHLGRYLRSLRGAA